MATPTYDLLASTTLATAASSVTFSSIDQSYGDLIIIVNSLGSTTLEARIRLNSDSGSNYNFARMSGNGSSGTSAELASQTSGSLSVIADATTGEAILLKLELQDYTATDKHKSMLARANQSATGSEATALRWASTAAVTAIEILTSTGNWAIGGTFNLYGVAK